MDFAFLYYTDQSKISTALGSWWVKGTEESTLEVDSSVPLTHPDPKDLGLICPVSKETQNPFSNSFGSKNPILGSLKETHSKFTFTVFCVL